MSCEQYLNLISARLDGPLSPGEEAELTAHLDTCPHCRAIADDLAHVHTTLSGCTAIPPAQLAEGVMKSIRSQRTARRRAFRRLGSLAACVVLCAGLFALTRPQMPTQEQTPMTARVLPDQPVTEGLSLTDELSFTNQQRLRLSGMSTSFAPTADLLGDTDSLSRCLARFPYNDLSAVTGTYGEDYFRTHRLLAVAVWEPSSSITHAVTALTGDCVTILRTVPEAGDTDVALWLILAEVEGAGPEAPLIVELSDN